MRRQPAQRESGAYDHCRNGYGFTLDEYKRAGQWPPPPGLTILIEEKPSAVAVAEHLGKLARIVTPRQREIVDRARAVNNE